VHEEASADVVMGDQLSREDQGGDQLARGFAASERRVMHGPHRYLSFEVERQLRYSTGFEPARDPEMPHLEPSEENYMVLSLRDLQVRFSDLDQEVAGLRPKPCALVPRSASRTPLRTPLTLYITLCVYIYISPICSHLGSRDG